MKKELIMTKEKKEQQMLARMWQNRNLIHCWWECKLVQPLWKAVWRFLKKLEIELPYDLVILLLGSKTKGCKTGYGRDTCIPMFIAALFTIAKLWKSRNGDIYIQWSITQSQVIMTCGLKVNGCNWRT
jgi:hypothetical protein